eukprot:g38326.t1
MQRDGKWSSTKLRVSDDQFQGVTVVKRKLESDLQQIAAENEELTTEFRGADEKAKKAVCEVVRLAEELHHEQEHTLHLERVKKGLEAQIKELNMKLEEAEQLALKGGKKIIQKLEGRQEWDVVRGNPLLTGASLLQVKELETELDGEQKRHGETVKSLRKNERRLKELVFQAEEDQKNQHRMQELVERLQNKLKAYKRQVEEA